MPESDTGHSFLARVFKTKDEAPTTLETSAQKREISSKADMIDAAEAFHILRVEDVMVPRADIIGIEQSSSLEELSSCFKEASHSRLPVYNDTLDDPIGMVHIKDVLPFLTFDAKGRSHKNYPQKQIITKILRPALYVPASMLAQELLRRMQARRIHMAIVVDEYGGTDGLVTVEDLVEPIVGEIDDEHAEDDPAIILSADGKNGKIWDIDARALITDVEAAFGREIATDEQEDDVDTLGGLVFTLAGHVPERGEVIQHAYGIEFEVLDADPRRVKRIRVRNTDQTKTDDS